jgi:hypothetical protein
MDVYQLPPSALELKLKIRSLYSTEKMDIELLQKKLRRAEEFDQRDEILLLRNKKIAGLLIEQNQHVENLFKGYQALKIVSPDTGETTTESPITREIFKQRFDILENEFQKNEADLAEPSDLYEYRKILENHIVKVFDLIDFRWESIRAFLDLRRKRRLESREESFKLMNQYQDLENYESEDWQKKAEQLFQQHNEMLDYQEKHLISEENLMTEIDQLFILRNKFIKLADEAFLA